MEPIASRPRPILYVHHRSELGGAPLSLSYLIRALDRSRWEPHVYCPDGAAAALFREAGAVVHTGPVAGLTHGWSSTYRGLRWLLLARELVRLPFHLLALRRVLRGRHFALVHLNDSPLIPAAWLARRHGLPVVWHLRSALPHEGADRRSRLVRRAVTRYATVSIAITADIAALFDIGSRVIPNPVDLERFHPGDAAETRRELELPEGCPVVAFFGYLYPSKGFRELLEAAAILTGRGVQATYLIVGGAVRGRAFFDSAAGRGLEFLGLAHDYEREARELVSRLGLDDSVRFVPFTPDTPSLYRASDVVVAPSRGLELGRSVLEGAATGVPVVTTGSRTGGGVVVPGETAVLVPELSVESLAETLAELLADGARRAQMGRKALEHARREFGSERTALLVEDVYTEALATAAFRPTIAYNALNVRPNAFAGAATFSLNVVPQLAEAMPHAHFVVYVPEGEDRIAPASNLELRQVGAASATAPGRVVLETLWLSLDLRRVAADVLVSPHESIPFRCPCPVVVIAQNLVYHEGSQRGSFQGWTLWERTATRLQAAYYRRRMARSYARAAEVVAISSHTADVLRTQAGLDPAKTVVVHGGSDSRFLPGVSPAEREPRLLAVAALAPYKKLDTTIDLFCRLRERRPELVLEIAGSDWRGFGRVLEEHASRRGVADAVRFLGPVGPQQVADLYRRSLLLLHLSSCESFGLPLVEAMRFGLPVVAAERSSLPEITGGAALLVDPDDLEGTFTAVEEALDQLLEELAAAGVRRARELVWSRTAAGLATVVDGVLGSSGRQRAAPSGSTMPRA